MTNKLLNLCFILLLALLLIFVYTTIHEGSHAIMALLFGAEITDFNINFLTGAPHISYQGDLSLHERALVSIAGPIFPFLLWMLISLTLYNHSNPIIHKVRLLVSISILGGMLPNIIIPVVNQLGHVQRGEDITNFMQSLSLNGYLVSFGILLLTVPGAYIFFRKLNPLQALCEEIQFSANLQKTWLLKGFAIVLAALVLIIAGNIIFPKSPNQRMTAPPKGYELIRTIDFSESAFTNEIFYEYTVSQPEILDMYFSAASMSTKTVTFVSDRTLPGMKVRELPVFSSDYGFSMANFLLLEGNYRLQLTSTKGKGKMNVYIQHRKANEELISFVQELENGRIPAQSDGYQLIAKQDLTDLQLSDETIYEFDVKSSANLLFSIYTTSSTGQVEVTLTGSNGYKTTLLTNVQLYTDGRGERLEKGHYQLKLSTQNSAGELYLYMKDNSN